MAPVSVRSYGEIAGSPAADPLAYDPIRCRGDIQPWRLARISCWVQTLHESRCSFLIFAGAGRRSLSVQLAHIPSAVCSFFCRRLLRLG